MGLRRARTLVLVLALTQSARAQPANADERALAEALFRDGKALLEAGDAAAACPKLEESRRLENAGGTVLALALCYERAGRNASAWAEYQVALALARRDQRADRAELARDRIAALEPTLYVVSVKVAEANRGLHGFEVRRDGRPLAAASWDVRVALDPGEHAFEASAPGYVAWRGALHVPSTPGALDFEIPPLAPSPPEASPEAAAAIPAQPVPARSAPARTTDVVPEPGPSAQRLLGYGLVATSVGVLSTASYFGLRSVAARARVAGACDGDVCPAEFEDDYDSARRWDRAALITAAAGLAAGGAGIYLLVRDGSRGSEESGLRKVSKTRTALGVSLTAAGGVALVASGVLGVRAVADSNRAWAECRVGACGSEQQRTLERAGTDRDAALALLSTGVVLSAAGAYFVWTRAEEPVEPRPAPRAALRVGPSQFAVEGSF